MTPSSATPGSLASAPTRSPTLLALSTSLAILTALLWSFATTVQLTTPYPARWAIGARCERVKIEVFRATRAGKPTLRAGKGHRMRDAHRGQGR
jgi:hypothetical protein